MVKTLILVCAALALKASSFQLSTQNNRTKRDARDTKPHERQDDRHGNHHDNHHSNGHLKDNVPKISNKPEDILGEQSQGAMTGHHYQASKWLAHQNRELIVKQQRHVFENLARQHPSYQRFTNWSMMDICNAKVDSNLGGMGPDFAAPKEIRYHAVAIDYLARSLDLLITNITAYKPYNAKRNQGNPCFAVVNVLHSTDVQMMFSLVFAGTSDVTTTSVFRLEDWDLDSNGVADGEEEIDVFYHGNGFSNSVVGYNLSSNSRVQVVRETDGIDFIAEDIGGGMDNPHNMDDMLDPSEFAEEVDLLSGAPQLMIDLKVNAGTYGRNYMFNMEYATTVTTTCGASCVIWGDPHVVTFDQESVRRKEHPLQEALLRTHGWKADQISMHAEGNYWLVKSENVKIQGRYERAPDLGPTATNLVEIAIGGNFMKGNQLKFGVQGKNSIYNAQPILTKFPSTFYKWHGPERLVAARYHSNSTMVKNGKRGPGIDLELPEGMRMTINRWKQNLAVVINMCPQAGGQDGHCGNYNGNPEDDMADVMMQRKDNKHHVSYRSSLFRRYSATRGMHEEDDEEVSGGFNGGHSGGTGDGDDEWRALDQAMEGVSGSGDEGDWSSNSASTAKKGNIDDYFKVLESTADKKQGQRKHKRGANRAKRKGRAPWRRAATLLCTTHSRPSVQAWKARYELP